MKNFKRGTKGITLIALLITIIVLLILAGVALNTLAGENGIINRTIGAKSKNERAEINENINLAIMDLMIDNGKANAENIKNDLLENNLYNEDEIQVLASDKIKIKNEEFEISGIEPKLIDYVNGAKRSLENENKIANTKTIRNYLIEKGIYTNEQLEVEAKDDFFDILKVGEDTAEVTTNRHTVYFEKPASWGNDSIYAYIWYDDSNNNTESYSSWPGVEISLAENETNIYKYQLPENENHEWNRIIFNNSTGGTQTKDLVMGNNGQVFTVPTNIIYAKTVGNFTDPLKIYTWKTVNSQTTQNAAWPGVEMPYFEDLDGSRVYYYNMSYGEGDIWANFIINSVALNSNTVQTQDIEYNIGKSNKIFCVRDEWVENANPPRLKETSENAIYGQWVNKQ